MYYSRLIIFFLFLSLSFCLNRSTVTINASNFFDWVYFSFTSGTVVVVENVTDDDWDIGLLRNHFRTNSGLSGLGDGGAAVDSSQIWTESLWSNYELTPELEFYEDSVIPNSLYDPITHTFVDIDGSTVLETWGWFDLENDYVFNYTDYIFVIKSQEGDYYKFWPSSYYNEYGESGYITFSYELIEENICFSGDVNSDNNLDVLDIVLMVNYILGQTVFSDEEICISDVNQDSNIDVLDIVWGVGIILNN